MSFNFPFTAFFPIPYKDKLYLAPELTKFSIHVYDINAKKIDTISKRYQPIKISSEYKSKTLQWFKTDPNWKNIYQFFKERISFKEFYPPIQQVIVDNDNIYALTYVFDKKGDRECIILDLKGKELKRIFLPVKENYGMDFQAPYNFSNNFFYIMKDNFEEEAWEIHRIKL